MKNQTLQEEGEPPKTNKGGRPAKDPDQRIEKGKTINTSQDELKRLNHIYQVMTAGTNKSFSSFAKEVIFALEQNSGAMRNRAPTSDQLGILMLELSLVKKELRIIGTLYNQVVRRINSLYVSSEIKQESQQHNKLFSQIEPLLLQLNMIVERIEKERE